MKAPSNAKARQQWFHDLYSVVDFDLISLEQKNVLFSYFGFGCDPLTLKQISKKYSFSMARTINLKRVALYKVNSLRFLGEQFVDTLYSFSFIPGVSSSIRQVTAGVVFRRVDDIILELIPCGGVFIFTEDYSYLGLNDTRHCAVSNSLDPSVVYSYHLTRVDSLNFIKSQKTALSSVAKFLLLGSADPVFLSLGFPTIGRILSFSKGTVTKCVRSLVDDGAIACSFGLTPKIELLDLSLLRLY